MPADEGLPKKVRDARERYDRAHDSYLRDRSQLEAIRAKLTTKPEGIKPGDEAWEELVYEHDVVLRGLVERLQVQSAELMTLTKDLEAVLAEANIEGSKLRTEALKQQATFSGAALVGITAIVQAILQTPLALILTLWLSSAFLLLGVCVSLILIHVEARRAEKSLRTGRVGVEGRWQNFWKGLYGASTVFLPAATVTFVVFFIANLPTDYDDQFTVCLVTEFSEVRLLACCNKCDQGASRLGRRKSHARSTDPVRWLPVRGRPLRVIRRAARRGQLPLRPMPAFPRTHRRIHGARAGRLQAVRR